MGMVEMIRLADEPWAPVAQGHPGAEVVRSVRVALRGTNVADHPAAEEVVSTPEAADPPLGCIGLFGLFLRSFKRSPTSFSRERKSAKIRATS